MSNPIFTTGFFIIVKIILSVAGVLHGLFPEALKVNVTEPFKISLTPGVYIGVGEVKFENVPSPVPLVQSIVLLTIFCPANGLDGTI